jgi:hypothetical protein
VHTPQSLHAHRLTARNPHTGDEEVQYVFVSLPEAAAASLQPGSSITIEGLATEQPVLRRQQPAAAAGAASTGAGTSTTPAAAVASAGSANNSSTTELQGRYVDTLGSVIIMQQQQQHSGASPAAAFKYLAHLDKQLQFGKAE